MDLKDTYNKIANDWHKDHQTDDWWIDVADNFLSFLKPGSHILDAGCGGGTKVKYLMQKGFKVTGIDFAEKMIEIAKKEVPQANFETLDIQNIDKLKDQFDGIFAQAVLLHIAKKDAAKTVQKLVNKLKKNGYIYIAVKQAWPTTPQEEIKEENDYGYSYKRFFSYFTKEEVEKYLKKANTNIVYSQITRYGNTYWIQLIAQK